jgi:NAD-dependent dihydropyrimidine dehydrogenase PreA subunit
MIVIFERTKKGEARPGDIEKLESLSHTVKLGSLCGLGQTAPNPVLTTLKYFPDEYRAHTEDRRCPAGVCKALIKYSIDAQTCVGCGACAVVCPSGAVSGTSKSPYTIDESRCIRCGACLEACKFGAIKVA